MVYDFQLYATKRRVNQLRQRIEALKQRLNEPGIVLELKAHVQEQFKEQRYS